VKSVSTVQGDIIVSRLNSFTSEHERLIV